MTLWYITPVSAPTSWLVPSSKWATRLPRESVTVEPTSIGPSDDTPASVPGSSEAPSASSAPMRPESRAISPSLSGSRPDASVGAGVTS